MKVIYTCIVFLFSILCFSQSNENIPDHKEIALFLEHLDVSGKKVEKVDQKIIPWTAYDIYGEQNLEIELSSFISGILRYKALQNYFKPEDLKFVEKQYLRQKDSIWQKNDFEKFNITGPKEQTKISEHSKKGQRMGSYYSYSFSVPLFSLDKKYALVIQQFYCGLMCSDQCTYLYERDSISNNWKPILSWYCGSA
ncbi:hypothetical protein [Flavobacterium reichenbachii]|uniref:Uncharacterized protein n=1 Tax=Flavobacterium reichenbachii TaxID=362418 RepID=A0A085ZMY0_9FLAO|nr:hypothetical protein [Flavobacterium reichenbachii]KFF05794.1 hypothetical protein IW19_09795 [Flavobacterium reichenbachii]OXB12682.1 hypothetical protein B0A68_17995 [Flavobacterium reichenbachii]